MNKLTEVITEKELFIPFLWMDNTPGGSNLGRAEFELCQIYKRGKLVEYFVYPRQQRNIENYWHFITNGYYGDFCINSFDNLPDPNPWMSFWCKEHKTIAIRIYVPSHSNFLWLNHSGIAFTKTDWKIK